MATDPKHGSHLVAIAGMTHFFNRSSPHRLMKAREITLVSFFLCLITFSVQTA